MKPEDYIEHLPFADGDPAVAPPEPQTPGQAKPHGIAWFGWRFYAEPLLAIFAELFVNLVMAFESDILVWHVIFDHEAREREKQEALVMAIEYFVFCAFAEVRQVLKDDPFLARIR